MPDKININKLYKQAGKPVPFQQFVTEFNNSNNNKSKKPGNFKNLTETFVIHETDIDIPQIPQPKFQPAMVVYPKKDKQYIKHSFLLSSLGVMIGIVAVLAYRKYE